MTSEHQVIKGKLGLLKLAQGLGNVSQACKMETVPNRGQQKIILQFLSGSRSITTVVLKLRPRFGTVSKVSL